LTSAVAWGGKNIFVIYLPKHAILQAFNEYLILIPANLLVHKLRHVGKYSGQSIIEV
jgi:hypothetical protein